VSSDGWLAAGQPEALDAIALNEDPGESLNLLKRHYIAPIKPLHAFFGHAVRAAEVAAIGDGDAEVFDVTAERIDQLFE
jgi:hypothetical protein